MSYHEPEVLSLLTESNAKHPTFGEQVVSTINFQAISYVFLISDFKSHVGRVSCNQRLKPAKLVDS